MRFRFKERILTWAVPIALAGVLIALAALQYRWSREVSDAASTRIQTSLQNALMNFRGDLAREFAMTCLDLQLDNGGRSDYPKELSERLEHWRRTSSHPTLVANVYLWDPARYEDLLFRLNRTPEHFALVPWPERLKKLRQQLAGYASHRMPEESGHGRQAESHAATEGKPPDITYEPERIPGVIDETIPMLIVPAVRRDAAEGVERSSTRLLLVELNPEVLRQSVLPQLSDRYFGEPGTSEYEVAVTTDSPRNPQVLYTSEAGFGSDNQVADATLNLFGPPGAQSATHAPMPPQMFGPWFGSRDKRGAQFPPRGISGGMFGELIRFDPIVYQPDQAAWQVVARDRQGSVAAAVASLRRRNLAVSFGVLAVLAATMGLILFASQRARRLATLQMDFVVGVSHELRTPIAAILSAAENIADGVVEDKPQAIRYGTMIRNQARQLSHLVEQVLRFAVTQSKAPSYSRHPLAVSSVINASLENTATMVHNAGFRVDLDIAANLPLVAADSEMFSQCMQNLITNAVKYGGESKWIGIRAYAVPAAERPEKVSIVVEDHGIGIAPQELGQIFEPFYRSPSVMASPIHGTGLGLTLAKSFAESMGGTLTVESEVGKGTAFTIHLPVANQPASEQNVRANVPASQRLT
jgi:two-component system, OmpR family, sensor histidine kinase SenX3